MKILNKFFDWLLKSSSDPSEVALTAKGLVGLGIVQGVFALLPSVGIHPSFDLNTLGDVIYSVVNAVLTAIAGIATLIGVIRKVYLTLQTPPPPVQ